MLGNNLKLCLVTHIQNRSLDDYLVFITKACQGGVTCVQLREKDKPLDEVRLIAQRLQQILTPLNIPLLINDHVTLAKDINADGVHIGQGDMSPITVRTILGPKKIIGLSIETKEQLDEANQLTCVDYVAASAVYSSQTKLDCKTIWGIHGLTEIVKTSLHPVMAIGGINQNNIKDVIQTGVMGVAVVSTIHDSSNPKEAVQALRSEINQCMK